MGFSHTHLSGTGIGDMMDFLVAPRTGAVKWVPERVRIPTRDTVRASDMKTK